MSVAVLLPVVALALIFGLVLADSLRQYRAGDETRLQDTARALAAAVDARLGTFLEVTQALVRSGMLDDLENMEAVAAVARRVTTGLPGWFVLIGPGPDHLVLMTSAPLPPDRLPGPIAAETRVILDELLEGVFIGGRAMVSDLFVGGVAGRQVLTAMVPIGGTATAAAALSLSFGPEAIQELLSRQHLPAGTFAAIGDGRFRIIAHSSAPDGSRVGLPAPAWIARAMAGRPRALLAGPCLDGQTHTYAIERPGLAPGWTVAVAQPLAEQQASAWRALRWLLAGGAALGLGLAAAVWAARQEAVRDARREVAALRTGRAEVSRLHGGLPAIIYLREVDPGGASRLLYRAGDLQADLGRSAATSDGVDAPAPGMEPEWPGIDALMARTLAEGRVIVEQHVRQPDGSWRWLCTRCRLLSRRPDGGGEVVGYVLDATAEHAAQARAVVAARMASLGEMAASLAHEIRQPLQSISLAAEVAQLAVRRADAAAAQERLGRIVEQAQRTSELIDRLRRFARGAEDGAPLEAVPLAAAVRGALELARSALHEAAIDVEVALGEPAPVVRGQAVLLEQVLSNLLLNARDALAARPAGAARRIRIAAAPGPEGTVRLRVADTGGGLAPPVMARLFEPFVTTKGPDKGTGLGLSICHGLVTGMGGGIDARNDADGAVFTITLPSAEASKAAIPGAEQGHRPALADAATRPMPGDGTSLPSARA